MERTIWERRLIRAGLRQRLAKAEEDGNHEKADRILRQMKDYGLYTDPGLRESPAFSRSIILTPGTYWKAMKGKMVCADCGCPVSVGQMTASLGYGQRKGQDGAWEWCLLSCKQCDWEIAMPLREIEYNPDMPLIGRDD